MVGASSKPHKSLSRYPQGLNLNLNSLLVKRQIDNLSPGAVTGAPRINLKIKE